MQCVTGRSAQLSVWPDTVGRRAGKPVGIFVPRAARPPAQVTPGAEAGRRPARQPFKSVTRAGAGAAASHRVNPPWADAARCWCPGAAQTGRLFSADPVTSVRHCRPAHDVCRDRSPAYSDVMDAWEVGTRLQT